MRKNYKHFVAHYLVIYCMFVARHQTKHESQECVRETVFIALKKMMNIAAVNVYSAPLLYFDCEIAVHVVVVFV